VEPSVSKPGNLSAWVESSLASAFVRGKPLFRSSIS
jgi:hypothetical protein